MYHGSQRGTGPRRSFRIRNELLGRRSRSVSCAFSLTLGSQVAHFPGAFGAHPDHDAHILSTLSAIQILTIHDGLDRMDTERVVRGNVPDGRHNGSLLTCHLVISSLQQPSGVFAGDSFGEVDTRFSYCAISALSLLGRLSEIDVDNAVSYIRNCRNFDGGFGSCVGAESHAAQGLPFYCARRFTHPS